MVEDLSSYFEALNKNVSEVGFKILKELKTANKLKALELYIKDIDRNYSFEKFNVKEYLQKIFLEE